ncbi:MAG: tol-pal system-associated acyl-CoA thioesterase [Pelagibacterales bacterium]|nr:tol-pal system-associated acyl-CoA thioesterase [Pelagibacterales bacterium]
MKKNHHFDIRVYYEDTDSEGIVYHSKYLNFAERARTELLREYNLVQSNIEKKYGLIFVVKSLNIDYVGLACLDDFLNIQTYISKLNKVKVIFSQFIYKKKVLIAKLDVSVCCLNKNRKVARMHDQIYDSLKKQEREYNE